MAIQDPLASAEQLLDILRCEHAALLGGDLDTIERLTGEKRVAIAALEALARTPWADGAERQRFALVAGECRRLNDINGGMVAAGLRHAQLALALLRGQDPLAGVYARSGAAAASTDSRPLAKA
jgi:flagellar biosynthesis/type III secretory pathway chaperone